MSLNAEWRDRLNAWRKELGRHLYLPLGEISLSGFVTVEQLTPSQAASRPFDPMPAGTAWGGKWEYGWFRGAIEVPAEAQGGWVVLRADVGGGQGLVGGEGLVFMDGRVVGSMDSRHENLTLTRHAAGGERFDVLIEAYAGHGSYVVSPGPTPPDRAAVPEPDAFQQTVGSSTFGLWREDVFQLRVDVETLVSLRDRLDPDSLRVQEIDDGLKDFTLICDFELPRDEMLRSVLEARGRLAPLLACTNGSTAPTMYCIGHGHLDVAWLWPLAECDRKIARTLSNQIALSEIYPEHKFLFSQPELYRRLKEKYPELYVRVKRAVADGHIVAEGGMWVEADTNIPSGESLIRQFIHGRRFFAEEFGVQSELFWLPDVFGYSAALPQIALGCGMKYFSTHKIFWTYHGGQTFPYHDFWWEGLDGSRLLSHLHNDYNSPTDPGTMIERWASRVQKDGMTARLVPFGWGDGGGGPDREHLEYIRREGNLEGCPRMRLSTPAEFFRDLEARGAADRYVGELYFQSHRGVLTSQARTKLGNRKGELALREAEMWGAAAATVTKNFAWPADRMDAAWKLLLLNQFHDILPGSSIHRVYEETEADYARILSEAADVAAAARKALLDGSDAVTVFNSLNWPRAALVELPTGWSGAVDETGRSLPAQTVGDRTVVEVAVPSCGWASIKLGDAGNDAPNDIVRAEAGSLENDLLKVTFDSVGRITRIYDKQAGMDFAAGPCNVMRMFKDVPARSDAWDIDSMYESQPVDLASGPAEIEPVASGPLMGALRIRRTLNDSTMSQTVTLRRGSRRIDFATTIDWRERHKLLKVCFDVDIRADHAVHEIQFGHICRPNHRSRPFDADRFEVCNHKWTALAESNRGAAVLNDCKYGVNVLGGRINLTLLRAPLGPDMHADRGPQEFTYSFYCWNGPMSDCDLVRQGYDLNVPPGTAAGAAPSGSILTTGADNIVVEAVKPAEDGSGDVIVRLYEAKRASTRAVLTVNLPATSACLTDMLERHLEDLPLNASRIELDFRPFEIKTVRLKIGGR